MSEAEILQRYDLYLCKQAHTFYRLSRQHTLTVEDFIQEARLAFLQHIRTHDKSMWAACTFTVKGAMMECVRRDYPVAVSRNHFKQMLQSGICFTSVDEIIDGHGAGCEDDHSGIDLLRFVDRLKEKDRAIIRMRLEGFSVVEIGKALNISPQAVYGHLKMIRRKLME